jgi:hypothetical protein
VNAMQMEYDSLSAMGGGSNATNRNASLVGSLGRWANVKSTTDNKKPAGGVNSGSNYGTGSGSSKVGGVGVSYDDAMAIALAASLEDSAAPPRGSSPVPAPAPAPAPPAPTSAGAYPPLPLSSGPPSVSAAAAAAAAVPAPKKKKPQPQAGSAAGGWADALHAMGMTSSSKVGGAKPASKLTVIKPSKSNSDLTSSASASTAAIAGCSSAGSSNSRDGSKSNSPTPDSIDLSSLQVIGKVSNDNNFQQLKGGNSNNSTATGVHKNGSWVKMGGAPPITYPDYVQQKQPVSDKDFPVLMGAKKSTK